VLNCFDCVLDAGHRSLLKAIGFRSAIYRKMPKSLRSSQQRHASSLHQPVKQQAIVAVVVAVLCAQALTTLCEAESNFKILHLWETHPPSVSTAWAELAQTALRGSAFFAGVRSYLDYAPGLHPYMQQTKACIISSWSCV